MDYLQAYTTILNGRNVQAHLHEHFQQMQFVVHT